MAANASSFTWKCSPLRSKGHNHTSSTWTLGRTVWSIQGSKLQWIIRYDQLTAGVFVNMDILTYWLMTPTGPYTQPMSNWGNHGYLLGTPCVNFPNLYPGTAGLLLQVTATYGAAQYGWRRKKRSIYNMLFVMTRHNVVRRLVKGWTRDGRVVTGNQNWTDDFHRDPKRRFAVRLQP